MIVAQRLVRRICADCKTVEETSPQLLIDAGYTPEEAKTVKVYKASGAPPAATKGTRGAAAFTRCWKSLTSFES